MNIKGYSKDSFRKLHDYLHEIIKSGKLPTGIVGIAQQDKVICMDAYGTWPDGKQSCIDDIYLLFSVTKPIVALAIMQLW